VEGYGILDELNDRLLSINVTQRPTGEKVHLQDSNKEGPVRLGQRQSIHSGRVVGADYGNLIKTIEAHPFFGSYGPLGADTPGGPVHFKITPSLF
jgi:hypothetical protein